jgi:hypothetical protein
MDLFTGLLEGGTSSKLEFWCIYLPFPKFCRVAREVGAETVDTAAVLKVKEILMCCSMY